MKVEDIIKIIEALGKAELTEFYLESHDFVLKMGKGTANNYEQIEKGEKRGLVEAVEKKELPLEGRNNIDKFKEVPKENNKENLVKITSPMVGTFYKAPSPDSPPFVQEGDMVKKGDTLCIIEAMKLMNEIESTENGKVVKVLVENGELVEYGQTLFLIEPV
ncbi:acetyl-CoA carboxylase biotin carboxyl carrier protein [Anaerobranca gottschalkii]|uniref:Biotin carboxyl carrier protein of acetyl-CoA carboxylase n=1 Tax=Anaerobranca gottschalkii DSM 13577 TaxID=1120990 RepID=A0A1H9Z1T0_9FIRM|nr:acetyl-CoA carboxylase biotin carboxyl carrier protein [Anaerobranca gottschalkii]SES75474.1 acetyl-CoA carboxylase biotin carboxyl carrier protein [Anaerobranca gottschalkii DSM 13577]